MKIKKRILVYSNIDSTRNIIVKALQSKDYNVVEVTTYNQAKMELNGTSFALVIVDRESKNVELVRIIEYMRDLISYLYTPILMLHVEKKELVVEQFSQFNVAYYMSKPFEMQTFHSVVERMA
jgi:DNA-binding response OmpR family regulator